MMSQSTVPIGVKPSPITFQLFHEDDTQLITSLAQFGYSGVLLPITNSKYRDFCKQTFKQFNINDEDEDQIRSNLQIPSPNAHQVSIFPGDHTTNLIGLISSWIELDTSNQFINEFSLQVLLNELNYANFIGLKLVLMAPPKNLNNLTIFTNNLNKLLMTFPNLKISISLPICEEDLIDPMTGDIISPVIDSLSTWDMWNSIRLQCNYHDNLTVSLALPKNNIPQYVINRWVLEPTSIFLISTANFVKNSKNYPVLNKFNQIILWKFIQKNWFKPPLLLLHGVDKLKPDFIDPSIHPVVNDIYLGDLSYLNYLKFISRTTDKNLQISPLELISIKFFGPNTNQTLQSPLQPLLHDLDNTTYKTFEADLVKYESYEMAMTLLLRDINTGLSRIEILIVGPGRGPLIDRLISAIGKTQRHNCRITLIEKNPNVIIYLQQRNRIAWSNSINIIHGDLRHYQFDNNVKFNLVISELLGSFGDNELAPECIYPLQLKCLDSCIYIPQSVTSSILPLIAPAIHRKLLMSREQDSSFHKPYLVLLNEFEILSSKFQDLWHFNHPNNNEPLKKFNKIAFKCRHKGLIHGIIGCFTLHLYGDISISNNPIHPQPLDLISWLPIFFPLETPIFLSDDQEVEILMKRDYHDKKIWYEWCIESFIYLILPTLKRSLKQNVNKTINHNSVFGGIMDKEEIKLKEEEQDEYQVRVRTGVSRVHNPNGVYHSMRL